MNVTARFNARAIRNVLLKRGGPTEAGFVRHAYRPFDTRWLYWEAETKLLDEKRAEYKPHVFKGNLWLVFQNKARPDLSPPLLISDIGDLNQMNSGVYCSPDWLRDGDLEFDSDGVQRRPNLSPDAQRYLESLDANVEDLFHHVLAVLHDPAYREANAGALRMEWPRIPHSGMARRQSRTEPQTTSPNPPHEAASSPPFSTPTPPSPASPSRIPERHPAAPSAPRSQQ